MKINNTEDKDISEQAIKRFSFLYFIVKTAIIGMLIFIVIQLFFQIFIKYTDDKSLNPENVDVLYHTYSGTFFIDMSKEYINSIDEYNAVMSDFDKKLIPFNYLKILLIIPILFGVINTLRNASKGYLFNKINSVVIFISAVSFFTISIITEITNYIAVQKTHNLYNDIFCTATYHPQIYQALILPFVLLMCAVIIKHGEFCLVHKDTKKIDFFFKTISYMLCFCTVIYLIWQIIYHGTDLIRLGINKAENMSVKIPFYSQYLDLPSNMAKFQAAYTKLIILRFLKEVPIIATVTICFISLAKLLFSYSQHNFISVKNKFRIKLILITAIITSIIYNLLGIIEVNILTKYFIGIYSDATYTIAIRSSCEPLVYVLYICIIFFIAHEHPINYTKNISH